MSDWVKPRVWEKITLSNYQEIHGVFNLLNLAYIPHFRYNNKTYRIDDINWEIFPTNTFHGRFKGVERDITYVEYYQEVQF